LTATEVNFSWSAWRSTFSSSGIHYPQVDWLEEHVGLMDVYENGELKTWAVTWNDDKIIFSFHDPQKAILFKLIWA